MSRPDPELLAALQAIRRGFGPDTQVIAVSANPPPEHAPPPPSRPDQPGLFVACLDPAPRPTIDPYIRRTTL
jgi:hypothetical protein